MNPPLLRVGTLLLFLALTVGGGILIGVSNPPGAWYVGLAKPVFTPPNWLFAPAWTVLYILVGIAGWRVFERDLGRPLLIWIAQLALNFAWSPLFFGQHLTGPALGVLVILFVVILAFIEETWKADRAAAVLFLPYAAWVAYAGALNGGVWLMN